MNTNRVATVLALFLFSGAAPALAEQPAPPTISVLTAAKKTITENLNATGSFAAGEMVLVSNQIDGLAVTDFLAEEGDTVKKDQVLVKLNSEVIDNQIQQATITRDKAAADLERIKRLRSTGVETAANLDQVQSAYDLANAQLAALNISKARTEIKSPVDGYIASRSVQIGAIASAAKGQMYEIVRNSEIEMLAEVPDSDLPRVMPGQKATVTINGFDQPVAGVVKLVSPQVNQQTRIGIVHIGVTSEKRIPIGAFGHATITLAQADAVALPLTAVTFGGAGPTVQVVHDGKVEVRKVATGLVGADDIEITKGIAPGETFVARAGSFVRDGDAVTPVPVTQ